MNEPPKALKTVWPLLYLTVFGISGYVAIMYLTSVVHADLTRPYRSMFFLIDFVLISLFCYCLRKLSISNHEHYVYFKQRMEHEYMNHRAAIDLMHREDVKRERLRQTLERMKPESNA